MFRPKFWISLSIYIICITYRPPLLSNLLKLWIKSTLAESFYKFYIILYFGYIVTYPWQIGDLFGMFLYSLFSTSTFFLKMSKFYCYLVFFVGFWLITRAVKELFHTWIDCFKRKKKKRERKEPSEKISLYIANWRFIWNVSV